MAFFRTRNILFAGLLICSLFIGNNGPVEATPLHGLLLLLPALLLKAGLAAPIVLLVIAKLGLLFGLKLKLLLPLLLSVFLSPATEAPYGVVSSYPSTVYGGISVSSSDDNLGRIKRSAEFVQSLVGNVETAQFDENMLLEQVFKMDSNKCGERLLCEIASAHAVEGIAEEEAALITFFTEEEILEKKDEELRKKESNTARHAYSKALLSGYRNGGNDCAFLYPTCPYSRAEMMQVVQIVNQLNLEGQNTYSEKAIKQTNEIPNFEKYIKS